MKEPHIKVPGVYIDEINALPNSVVPVATAVPAFIGYTPQAEFKGVSYLNVAQKISSFADFQAIYCYPSPPAPADPTKQYAPQYYLVPQQSQPASGDYMMTDGIYYSIVPDPNTVYYLFNSIQLFYQNGGGDAYIVAVGTYGAPSNRPMDPAVQIINPNVHLTDLTNGLALLANEPEPTMYICPEATLLSVNDNATLTQKMLLQSTVTQTAICILDPIGGRNPDPVLYMNDIQTFREGVGAVGLNYGAAYYPFIGTAIMQSGDIDYTNLFGGDINQLASIINPVDNPNPAVAAVLKNIETAPTPPLSVSQNNAALINASSEYSLLMAHVLADANILPASGAIAGVITVTDSNSGPWQAPANTSIVNAVSLPINLTEAQQQPLNLDPISGKSINAIRFFNGIGILVWGARTLDGNSEDWRYITVRRTVIYIEQSCKIAAQAYVFAPNDKNTWAAVKSLISNFLISVWKEGGLQGASASDAFSVECGLGSTMTSEDILNGIMVVSVLVAIVHPAEFILITFQQQMASSL